MVWELRCNRQLKKEISTMNDFEELKEVIEQKINQKKWKSIEVKKPFYVWNDPETNEVVKWYASMWYKCLESKCLWEVDYPDFPAKGFIRNFPDGVYHEEE